jgi:S-(hydroxymethyl)glutathione dehydrogenase/alcohol dehydrogenase
VKCKAVVVHELGRLVVEEVELDEPRNDELLVRLGATGVCHSDLSVLNGTISQPLPMVLGHEGAGVVEKVGEGVRHPAVGDHVVLSMVPSCGDCYFCLRGEQQFCRAAKGDGKMLDGTSRLHMNGSDLGAFQNLGCMAEFAVVPTASVLEIDDSIPFEQAALVGCGVMTGAGAAMKTAAVAPGSTVAVFGCGGVGLSIIQGARIAGAATIIAVDLSDEKLALARELGATHTANAADDPLASVRAITGKVGVDYAFEAIGIGSVMEQAYTAARRGGTVCIVGMGKMSDSAALNAFLCAFQGKKIVGCWYGSANFRVDMPMLLELSRKGALDLGKMVTRTYGIDEAPEAFDDLEAGRNARGVIVYG